MRAVINRLHFYLKIPFLLASRKVVPVDTVEDDYDLLAPTYDEYFSNFTKSHSQELVRKLGMHDGAFVLDLACGTGTITAEIRKYAGEKGRIIAADFSKEMLKKAEEKLKGGAEFVHGDMLAVIDTFDKNFFDYITCGWAIGYSDPIQLLKKLRRVLKHNGKIGIIENRRDSLAVLRKTGIKVMQRYPRHIKHIMDLPFRLPKDKSSLKKLFQKSGLMPLETWDGEINFNFKDGTEALNWALHTGASAGFDKIMDPKARKLCDDAFIEIIERDHRTERGINITHKYVAGIAQKL